SLLSSCYTNPHATYPAPLSFPTRRSSDLNRVSAVLIDASTAPTITNARRRDRIFLLGSDPGPPDYHTALSIRAEQAFLLPAQTRSEEHTTELQSRFDLVCRLLLEKQK